MSSLLPRDSTWLIRLTIKLIRCVFTVLYFFSCNGGDPMAAWKYWVRDGIVTGSNFTTHAGCKPYPFPPCEHHSNKTHYKPCQHDLYPTPKCEKKCQSGYEKEYKEDRFFGMWKKIRLKNSFRQTSIRCWWRRWGYTKGTHDSWSVRNRFWGLWRFLELPRRSLYRKFNSIEKTIF